MKKLPDDFKRASELRQTVFERRAERIVTAIKEGSVETPHYQPWFLDDSEYLETARTFVNRAVNKIWNNEQRPTKTRYEAPTLAIELIWEDKHGEWKWYKPPRDPESDEYKQFHSTMVRRLNELADPKYWDGPTPLISLDPEEPGQYCPNWALWEEPYRSRMIASLSALGYKIPSKLDEVKPS